MHIVFNRFSSIKQKRPESKYSGRFCFYFQIANETIFCFKWVNPMMLLLKIALRVKKIWNLKVSIWIL